MYKLEMSLGFAAQKFCSLWLQLFISFIIENIANSPETYSNCSNKPALSIFEPII